MNNEKIYEEVYRGHTIQVYQDTDYQSPDEWGDDDDTFLVGYHREFWIKRDGFSEDRVKNALQDKYTSACCEAELTEKQCEGCGQENAPRMIHPLNKEYHILPLEAYIHSGVSLALMNEGNFVDRGWDVSLVGAVFVKRASGRTFATARKYAKGLVQSWNDYLSGNVYGYQAGEDGEIGSCWGFYGDYEKSGLLENARGEIDFFVENKRKEKQKQTKAYLVNRVPLSARK